MSAPILKPTDGALQRAVETLRGGGLVAMPTETVYGLACDASNGEAIARLYAAKGRPSFNPLIAHVASGGMDQREAVWDDSSAGLVGSFWPGPLTVVLPFAQETGTVSDLARAGLDTIALRQPDHPVAADLIAAFGAPIVAPSANPSGQISPTTAAHVAADMGDKVHLILDGGPCEVGLESTIVSFVGPEPTLLRPGGLDPSRIESALGRKLLQSRDHPDAPSSPGQLLRHYSPSATLRLDAETARDGESHLGFGATGGTLNLSPTGSLTEAAANLFTMLRQLDETSTAICVAPIPHTGLGLAINDRLSRAAN
jgi:L-threonylcarbamoyladenylate synthase